VVTTVDIDTGKSIDSLIADGKLAIVEIPQSQYVGGAQAEVREFEGMYATAPMLANEQITWSRLSYCTPKEEATESCSV
jgi:hypothetical protein